MAHEFCTQGVLSCIGTATVWIAIAYWKHHRSAPTGPMLQRSPLTVGALMHSIPAKRAGYRMLTSTGPPDAALDRHTRSSWGEICPDRCTTSDDLSTSWRHALPWALSRQNGPEIILVAARFETKPISSIIFTPGNCVFSGWTLALLRKECEGRTSPYPGRTYPTGSVTGMPSAV